MPMAYALTVPKNSLHYALGCDPHVMHTVAAVVGVLYTTCLFTVPLTRDVNMLMVSVLVLTARAEY